MPVMEQKQIIILLTNAQRREHYQLAVFSIPIPVQQQLHRPVTIQMVLLTGHLKVV
jgi:hypothetical protein